MPQKKRTKPPVGKKVCTACGKEKSLTQFYTTKNNKISNDGKTANVCKNCIKRNSYNIDGTLNIEAFQQMLMLMDRPYVPEAIDSAINEVKRSLEIGKGRTDIIGCYFRIISSLPQYTKLTFLDSMNLANQGKSITEAVTTTEKRIKLSVNDDIYVNQVDDFVVTSEILDLFGEGYTKPQYRKMKKKFDKLKENYLIQTNLHEEALSTYVRFKIKEEEATAIGNVGEAEKWNKAAQDAADKAKLTPKQLTAEDLQGGVSSFSEIFEAIEGAKDVIKILPRFTQQPNDMPDFIIWNYINYERDLNNLPHVSYDEIYQFYDEKKEEYLKEHGDPFGIFANDKSQGETQRETIKKFITVTDEFADKDSDD
ncbi:MAG: hypothetical protein K2F81_05545 [Ruminococcus sp.]|nr:hypothetical protein [Ruminococcus sp.]